MCYTKQVYHHFFSPFFYVITNHLLLSSGLGGLTNSYREQVHTMIFRKQMLKKLFLLQEKLFSCTFLLFLRWRKKMKCLLNIQFSEIPVCPDQQSRHSLSQLSSVVHCKREIEKAHMKHNCISTTIVLSTSIHCTSAQYWIMHSRTLELDAS